jgi:enoyl-CoA hydratase/carnithine racemase
MNDAFVDRGLRYRIDGGLATITLCRPETLNAQTPGMWEALRDIERAIPPEVRVVIIRAEGQSFSSGLDRRMWTSEGVPGELSLLSMEGLDDAELTAVIASYQDAFTWLRRPELITIAAVQGHAIGAGFQLALACDFRVLSEDARFAMLETSLGLVPDLGGTHPLVEAIGYPRALEICVTGRWVDADEARQLGLATIVVAREDLDGTVSDLADAVMAPMHRAVTGTKALLRTATAHNYSEQLIAERSAQVSRIRDLAALVAASGERAGGNKSA